MPKDVYYIKHDADAHNDPKIKAMRKNYGWEGFGWYWLIIATMRTSTDYKLEYNDITFDSFADDMGCDKEKTKKYIDDCINSFKLFSKNGTHFYSNRLIRDMNDYESIKQQRYIAGKISGIKRSTRSTNDEQMLSERTNDSSTNDEQMLNPKANNEQMLNERSTNAELLNKEDILNKENKEKNVFSVYENNIGGITSFISEELKDIEKTYPYEWFEKAVKIACMNNAKSLKYIQAILQRWQVSGFKENKPKPTNYDPRTRYKRAN